MIRLTIKMDLIGIMMKVIKPIQKILSFKNLPKGQMIILLQTSEFLNKTNQNNQWQPWYLNSLLCLKFYHKWLKKNQKLTLKQRLKTLTTSLKTLIKIKILINILINRLMATMMISHQLCNLWMKLRSISNLLLKFMKLISKPFLQGDVVYQTKNKWIWQLKRPPSQLMFQL